MASPSAGDPALKYGDVNTVTPSPGEVKGLNIEYLNEIFYNCKELKSINISHMLQRLLVLLKIALIDVTHLKFWIYQDFN